MTLPKQLPIGQMDVHAVNSLPALVAVACDSKTSLQRKLDVWRRVAFILFANPVAAAELFCSENLFQPLKIMFEKQQTATTFQASSEYLWVSVCN